MLPLPLPLPRASLIHFHYIFAIGELRCTSLFNFQLCVARQPLQFYLAFLPFLLGTFVPISIARPSVQLLPPRLTIQHPSLTEFVFTDDDLFLDNVDLSKWTLTGLIVKLENLWRLKKHLFSEISRYTLFLRAKCTTQKFLQLEPTQGHFVARPVKNWAYKFPLISREFYSVETKISTVTLADRARARARGRGTRRETKT